MAARKGPLTETKLDEMRRRIKTTLLLKALEDHALGQGEELSTARLKAIEILLRKTMPDLASVQHSGDPDNPVGLAVSLNVVGVPASPAP